MSRAAALAQATVPAKAAKAGSVVEPAAAVRAAGVLIWKRKKSGLRVAVVHRPQYDDWSWPKGKLDRGEDSAAAAEREAFEETGYRVRLGLPLPLSNYQMVKGSRSLSKRVEYWAATVVGGSGQLLHEVDEVKWLKPEKARARLTYQRDREQLDALVAADAEDMLDVWTFVVVRHALAVNRKDWKGGPDMLRPLNAVGKRRSEKLIPILTAYGPEQVLSSTSTRCHDTVAPFAQRAFIPLRTKRGLSEEGYDAAPDKVAKHVRMTFERGRTIAFCTHGPVLEAVLDQLKPRSEDPLVTRTLKRLTATNMDKGEILACTVVGKGPTAQIVAVRRHRIPR